MGVEMMGALRLAALVIAMSALAVRPVPADTVTLLRTPNGGIQPQAVLDGKGTLHLIYFKGDERAGNLFYVRRLPGAADFSKPIRVNSEPNTAMAVGTVRVANIALGPDGRAMVGWNGLGPKGPNGYPEAYPAFTRLSDAGTEFEPQRNVSQWARGLDGGGSLAADGAGRVYMVWHALAGARDETGRAVYVAISTDGGKTFAREKMANPEPLGACGCCALRAFVTHSGALTVLYRSADRKVNRDTMLLVSSDYGATFQEQKLDSWKIDTCPMSTYSMAQAPGGTLTAAWETEGHVFAARLPGAGYTPTARIACVGESQKHPSIGVGAGGSLLAAWAEGTGWNRGGSLVWQLYDAAGRPSAVRGRTGDLPVWGLPSVVADAGGKFIIVY